MSKSKSKADLTKRMPKLCSHCKVEYVELEAGLERPDLCDDCWFDWSNMEIEVTAEVALILRTN